MTLVIHSLFDLDMINSNFVMLRLMGAIDPFMSMANGGGGKGSVPTPPPPPPAAPPPTPSTPASLKPASTNDEANNPANQGKRSLRVDLSNSSGAASGGLGLSITK
jgi:hypothetical protein